jgi:hypothetical protein
MYMKRYGFGALFIVTCLLWGCVSAKTTFANGKHKEVLVIGNSITRHGPSPKISWLNNWGMAASRSNLDFVSVLFTLITTRHRGEAFRQHVISLAKLERDDNFMLSPKDIGDIGNVKFAIVQLGDNAGKTVGEIDRFLMRYEDLLTRLSSAASPDLVLRCVGTWWHKSAMDFRIKSICEKHGGKFVLIGDLHTDIRNSASHENSGLHPGVGAHPGDRGMYAIAERIFQSFDSDPLVP